MTPRKIVLFARKMDQGGAERQILGLARGLMAKGHDLHVVLFYSGGVFYDALLAHGVPVVVLDKKGRYDVVSFMWRLWRTLWRLRPQVIYTFMDVPNGLATLLRPFLPKTTIIWGVRSSFLEGQHYDWARRLAEAMEGWLSHQTQGIIANSQAGAQWLAQRGFPTAKLAVVDNGIDTASFTPQPQGRTLLRQHWGVSQDACLIGLVGRLDPMKDHPTFLQACALLTTLHPPMRFMCIGSGGTPAYANHLKDLALSLGLGEAILWLEGQKDMPPVYSALDMVVSASAFGEGFPNVVGEAMACGRPCVVTTVGDSPRIVGDLGIVVPPRDPAALAGAIATMKARLDNEPDLAFRLRQRIVENFSLEVMVNATETVLMRWS